MPFLPAATENAMVQAGIVPGTTYYMSLHSDTPGTSGTNEITGGSYTRQAIVFSTAVGGVMSNTGIVSFATLPAEAGGIPYFGLWTAATAGTFVGGGSVSGVPGPMGAGTSLTLAVGTVQAAQT